MEKFVLPKSTEKGQKRKPSEEETKSSPKKSKTGTALPAAPSSGSSTASYEDWLSQMHESWKTALGQFISAGKLRSIYNWVSQEYTDHVCRPIASEIFTAFRLVPFDKIKVVVVGQDPYPGPVEAMGLSFSVHRGVQVPGSLRNIYKCMQQDKDLNFIPPKHGDLTAWAQQGVFMLNAVLTVRQGFANSHAKKGWEAFTDEVIKAINRDNAGVVYMLWGAYAQEKAAGVNKNANLILKACHPSPLSASKGGFYTCGHFSKANAYLKANGKGEIDWSL